MAITEPTSLETADVETLESIRAKLQRLEKLTHIGTPGIRQLRQILRGDIREIDIALAAAAPRRAAAQAARRPGASAGPQHDGAGASGATGRLVSAEETP